MCLIGMRVRPSSTLSCTGMSRIMLMSLPAPPPAPAFGAKLAKAAGASACIGTLPPSAALLSASAAAHSAAIASSAGAAALFSDMRLSQPARAGAGQQLVHLDRVLAARGAVVAGEHRHAVDLGLDRGVQVQLDEVARLQGEELLDRRRCAREFGHQLDLGRLDLLLEQIHPAPIGLVGVALDG